MLPLAFVKDGILPYAAMKKKGWDIGLFAYCKFYCSEQESRYYLFIFHCIARLIFRSS